MPFLAKSSRFLRGENVYFLLLWDDTKKGSSMRDYCKNGNFGSPVLGQTQMLYTEHDVALGHPYHKFHNSGYLLKKRPR
jgi:hypothetical protein